MKVFQVIGVIQTFISDWIGDLKSDVIINPPCKLSK
jgi:hypothetical protein